MNRLLLASPMLVGLLMLGSACQRRADTASPEPSPSTTPANTAMPDLRSDPEALAVFDGRSLSYTYENGWSFTNYFEGELRITDVKDKTLREEVTITEPAPKLYFIVWEDANMGLIAQVVNLQDNTLQVAVKHKGNVEVWKATITAFE